MEELMEVEWDCNLFYCVVGCGEELAPSIEAVEKHCLAACTGVAEGTSLSDAVGKVKEACGFTSGDKIFGLRLQPLASWIDVTSAASPKECKKGMTLHFKVVPAQQHGESRSSQQKIDIMITKIEEMLHVFFHATSKTRLASSINDDDLKKLRESIRVEEPIYKHSSGRFLHNVPVESLILVRRQNFWTPDKSETQHRTAYMDYLRSKFKAEGFEWIDTNAPGQNYILESNFNELAPFKVSAKNDAVLCRNGCSFSAGASVGIELKRDLTEKLTQYLRQAETEFYLWADASKYVFTQVLTDLECGGAAFYYNGEDVVCEAFFGMQELEAFLKKNLEESGDAPEGGQRKRFRPGSLPRYGQIGDRYNQIGGSGGLQDEGGSGEGGPTPEQVALWMLGSRIMNNLDDVANDSDFVGMNIPEICSF